MAPPVKEPPLKAPPPPRPNTTPHAIYRIPQTPLLDKNVHQAIRQQTDPQVASARNWIPPLKAPPPAIPVREGDRHYGTESRSSQIANAKVMRMAVAKVPLQPQPPMRHQPLDPMTDPVCERLRNARYTGANENARNWSDDRNQVPSILRRNRDGIKTAAGGDSLVVPAKYSN